MYKQVILVRKDLKLPKGKAAAQAAHAAVEAAWRADKTVVQQWRQEGQKKVILAVLDEAMLYGYLQQAKDAGLPTALISDAGRTVVEPGTVTACAIGPHEEEQVDACTRDLGLY